MLPSDFLCQIDDTTAHGWIHAVTPVARGLVNWTELIVDVERTVEGVGIAEREGLYGPLMLSWFDDRTSRPRIYYLREHAIYLRMSARCFQEFLSCEDVWMAALSDGSRMRVAITNDVLQVMAPTPPGKYSMIRHHALMFLAATLWLPSEQKERWLEIYRCSLRAVYPELSAAYDLKGLLLEVEERAFFIFNQADALTSAEDADEAIAHLVDAEIPGIARYMAYCYAAVGVLADRLERERMQGWSDDAWLAREIARYRSDYYLFEDLELLGCPRRQVMRIAGAGSLTKTEGTGDEG